MNTKGVQLQLMIGPTVPVPAPKILAEALDRVEVSHSDQERSGFQLVFRIDTSGPAGMAAEVLLNSPLFTVFNRVVLTVIFKGMPHVLMDGIITNQELQPGAETAGMAVFTLTASRSYRFPSYLSISAIAAGGTS